MTDCGGIGNNLRRSLRILRNTQTYDPPQQAGKAGPRPFIGFFAHAAEWTTSYSIESVEDGDLLWVDQARWLTGQFNKESLIDCNGPMALLSVYFLWSSIHSWIDALGELTHHCTSNVNFWLVFWCSFVWGVWLITWRRASMQPELEHEHQSILPLLAAVMEYLSAEILELADNAAKDNKKTRTVPRHIQLAVRNDEELSIFLSKVTIASGGVLPNIHAVLLPKRAWRRKSRNSKIFHTNACLILRMW